jgi:hypothetical protein
MYLLPSKQLLFIFNRCLDGLVVYSKRLDAGDSILFFFNLSVTSSARSLSVSGRLVYIAVYAVQVAAFRELYVRLRQQGRIMLQILASDSLTFAAYEESIPFIYRVISISLLTIPPLRSNSRS